MSFFLLGSLFGCSGGAKEVSLAVPAVPQNPQQVPTSSVQNPYSTSIVPLATAHVLAKDGGVVTVSKAGSALDGLKLTIPSGALPNDTDISIGSVSNPPALPIGFNFVGAPMQFGPRSLTFSSQIKLEWPFSDIDLNQAGVLSKSDLKLFSFDESVGAWKEIGITGIDEAKNLITADLNNFSFYALVGLSGMPPDDLGHPQPADLLYVLSSYDFGRTFGWIPGHVRIYTGEKKWNGEKPDFATEDVKRCGLYNIIEAMPFVGIRRAYAQIPNTVQSCSTNDIMSVKNGYMGAREASDFSISLSDRASGIEYAEGTVGRNYAMGESFFGLLDGQFVKGPLDFNCVGLAEAMFEYMKVNNGKGLVEDDDWALLTPAWQYSKTKPAGGVIIGPVINWATITPNFGTYNTQVVVQISVSHSLGIDHIDSVRYSTDSGYTNPAVNINDKGVGSDQQAGDGIYTLQAPIGWDFKSDTLGLNFIVTDKDGKTASTHLVFTYDRSVFKQVAKNASVIANSNALTH